MAQVGFDADYSDDEQYHSAGDSPPPSRAQELWTFDRDIGQGGFGIVKLFVHKVDTEHYNQVYNRTRSPAAHGGEACS